MARCLRSGAGHRSSASIRQLCSQSSAIRARRLAHSWLRRLSACRRTCRDPAVDARLQVNRLLPLEGGRNFRDLGGYATRDGRRVRWGRVYRSGVMSYLTDADRTRLDALGLRTLCDFRAPGERKREPTNWWSPDVQLLHWDYDFRNVSLR